MELKFQVHSASAQPRNAVGDFNGQMLSAPVPGFEVELTDPEGVHGSMSLFFRSPEEIELAKAIFAQDAVVTFSVADPVTEA